MPTHEHFIPAIVALGAIDASGPGRRSPAAVLRNAGRTEVTRSTLNASASIRSSAACRHGQNLCRDLLRTAPVSIDDQIRRQ